MNKTQIFKELHASPNLLVLANVWDAGSARMVEALGAKAIATTSAGVAWANGYPDGNVMPIQVQADLAAAIVRAVSVPVSVDFEAGYSDDPSVVAENLKPLVSAGISGINLEDGNDDPVLLAKKIEAIKAMVSQEGADIFINARADVFLKNLVPDDQKISESLRRAFLYQSAGADGLFVPGLVEPSEITEITQGTELPVNLLWPNLPKLAELRELGVRRLSAGSGISQYVHRFAAGLAEKFLKEGDLGLADGEARPYAQLQELFSGVAR